MAAIDRTPLETPLVGFTTSGSMVFCGPVVQFHRIWDESNRKGILKMLSSYGRIGLRLSYVFISIIVDLGPLRSTEREGAYARVRIGSRGWRGPSRV